MEESIKISCVSMSMFREYWAAISIVQNICRTKLHQLLLMPPNKKWHIFTVPPLISLSLFLLHSVLHCGMRLKLCPGTVMQPAGTYDEYILHSCVFRYQLKPCCCTCTVQDCCITIKHAVFFLQHQLLIND